MSYSFSHHETHSCRQELQTWNFSQKQPGSRNQNYQADISDDYSMNKHPYLTAAPVTNRAEYIRQHCAKSSSQPSDFKSQQNHQHSNPTNSLTHSANKQPVFFEDDFTNYILGKDYHGLNQDFHSQQHLPLKQRTNSWHQQHDWKQGTAIDEFRRPSVAESLPGVGAPKIAGFSTDRTHSQERGYREPDQSSTLPGYSCATHYEADSLGQRGTQYSAECKQEPIDVVPELKMLKAKVNPAKELRSNNPLQMLGELNIRICWTVSDEKSSEGLFAATIIYNSTQHTATGTSKKSAQRSAARLLLQSLGYNPPQLPDNSSECSGNAISQLHNLVAVKRLSMKLDFTYSGDSPLFTCCLSVGDRDFLGTGKIRGLGSKKKMAKAICAESVLTAIETGAIDLTFYRNTQSMLANSDSQHLTPSPKKRRVVESAAVTEGESTEREGTEPLNVIKTRPCDNPVSRVTSMFSAGVEWSFTRDGPPHIPVFSATARLIGYQQHFSAQGENKKIAKYSTCLRVLSAVESGAMLPPPKAPRITAERDPVDMCVRWFGPLDWRKICPEAAGGSNSELYVQVTAGGRSFIGKGADMTEAVRDGSEQIYEAAKFGELVKYFPDVPWSVIPHLFPGTKWEYQSIGPSHEPAYTALTTVQGTTFQANAGSKKAARQECCRLIMDALNAGTVQAPPRKGKDVAGFHRFSRLFRSPEIRISETASRVEDTTSPVEDTTSRVKDHRVKREGQQPVFTASTTIFGRDYSATGDSETQATENLVLMCNDMYARREIEVPVMAKFTDKFDNQIQVDQVGGSFNAYFIHMDYPYTASGYKTREAAEVAVASQVLDAAAKSANGRDTPASGKKGTSSNETPLAKLNSIGSERYEFTIEQTGTKSSPFVVSTEIAGKVYRGTGRNKTTAKQACASVILSEVHGHQFDVGQVGGSESAADLDRGDIGGLDQQALSTRVRSMVEAQYTSIAQRVGPKFSQRKVLAGCVLTVGDNLDGAELIAIACGNKCVEGGMVSAFGDVVNDMHAEVLIRRLMKRYLYEQIKNLQDYLPSIIQNANNKSGPKYRLTDGARFHLYISSPPCGDSRLFTVSSAPAGETNGASRDDNPNRASRGQLRVKIEAGQGTVLFNEPERGSEQNWEAVMSGERYINMSCSDKVARWSVLGFQGSLLSKIMEPVYFSSVIVGSMFHKEHIYRALYGRLKGSVPTNEMPAGFRHQCPEIIGTIVPEPRNAQKAPSHAVTWVASDDHLEILDTRKGVTYDQAQSSVCKRALFTSYRRVNDCSDLNDYYDAEKKSATEYQKLKVRLYSAIAARGLGSWVSKIPEQDMFVFKTPLRSDPGSVANLDTVSVCTSNGNDTFRADATATSQVELPYSTGVTTYE